MSNWLYDILNEAERDVRSWPKGLKRGVDTTMTDNVRLESITSFHGKYKFLSNFFMTVTKFDGVEYPSAEHAYQAAKTLDLDERDMIRRAHSAADAKKLGKTVTLRRDWALVRTSIMLDIVRDKFTHPYLREQLVATSDAELIEVNKWYDRFWGQCPLGDGENWLGRILMLIREECNDA